jgi:hypothetical protein
MTPKYCGCQSSVRIATALADLDSAAVRRVYSVTSARGAEVDARIDQERRRRLSAFLLNRRQRVNSNAVRVGTYARPESRIGRPLTQEEVAEALGVSRQWYGALERALSPRGHLRRRLPRPESSTPRRIRAPRVLMSTIGRRRHAVAPARSRIISSWDRSRPLGVRPDARCAVVAATSMIGTRRTRECSALPLHSSCTSPMNSPVPRMPSSSLMPRHGCWD